MKKTSLLTDKTEKKNLCETGIPTFKNANLDVRDNAGKYFRVGNSQSMSGSNIKKKT